jgi:hypothetical protein
MSDGDEDEDDEDDEDEQPGQPELGAGEGPLTAERAEALIEKAIG